jgi:predicted ferric reductase
MNRTLAGVAWVALYLLVVLVPMFLMLLPPLPSGRTFWLEFAVALGFVGLIQLAVQFVLIARFRPLTAPYGIDVILQYHRQIALVAVAVILVHPVIIIVDNPSRLELLNPFGGTIASRFGILAILALSTLVLTSVFRERLGFRYEAWRFTHLALGLITVAFAQAHVSLAGLYTNAPWKQAVWVVSAVMMLCLVVYLRVIRPWRQRRSPWQVSRVESLPGATVALTLEPQGHAGMRFAPGQFAWIKLANSPFTLEEHPFSFSSSAEDTGRLEFGIKGLGDFSARVGSIPAGTTAFIDGPHGAFSIDRYQAPGYVFIAGGVGITPIMSFLRTMADREDPRPVLLIYADTSLEEMSYREELVPLEKRLSLAIVDLPEKPPPDWEGEHGLVDADLLGRVLPEERFARDVFVCGPPPMMDAVQAALLARDVPRERIHLERFVLA